MEAQKIKTELYLFCHKCFWRFMWFTKLARPYSKLACKFNFYPKFQLSNACKWCGKVH